MNQEVSFQHWLQVDAKTTDWDCLWRSVTFVQRLLLGEQRCRSDWDIGHRWSLQSRTDRLPKKRKAKGDLDREQASSW